MQEYGDRIRPGLGVADRLPQSAIAIALDVHHELARLAGEGEVQAALRRVGRGDAAGG